MVAKNSRQPTKREPRVPHPHGVPCFIVAGKYVINGAQPPEMWENVLKDIEAQLEKA